MTTAVETPSKSSNGILLLDKPTGISSFQALYPVKRLFGKKVEGKKGAKVGHAGTLDPAASGLLLVGIGAATRLLEFLEGMPKSYRFVLHLGITTDSYDLDGEVLTRADASGVTRAQIEALLPRFIGDIEQVPPAYSAIKIDGKRAYERARAGEDVAMPARPVHVSRLEILSFDPGLRREDGESKAASAVMELDCSKGTYVRTIAHDLGALLGCGAVAEGIRRTAIGPYRVEDAVAPDAVRPEDLFPIASAVAHLTAYTLKPDGVAVLMNGNAVPPAGYAPRVRTEQQAKEAEAARAALPAVDDSVAAIFGPDDRLLAIGEVDARGQLQPRKVFPD